MYFAILALLMFILPLVSTVVESGGHLTAGLIGIAGKWFVFYAMGLRLLLAGVKQITDPRFTAKVLGLKSDEVLFVVRELGFANFSLGVVGVVSLFLPAWVPAAALAGGIFYLLAGVNHAREKHRTPRQNIAMATDLWAAVVLLVFVTLTLSR